MSEDAFATEASSTDPTLLTEVTAFIWAESALLDAKEYDAWLKLWTDSGIYVMPMEEGDDFKNQLNLCYDNAKMRRDRIGRFYNGFAISSTPAAKTARTVSRFTIDRIEGDYIVVSCAEQLIEDKFGRQRIWAGNVRYTLVRSDTDQDFLLHEKVVRLLNADGVLNSFSYLF